MPDLQASKLISTTPFLDIMPDLHKRIVLIMHKIIADKYTEIVPHSSIGSISSLLYLKIIVNCPTRPAEAESFEASRCTARVEGPPSYTGQTHALYLLLRRVLIFLLIPDAVRDSQPLRLMTHSAFFRRNACFQTSTDHTCARYSASRLHPR